MADRIDLFRLIGGFFFSAYYSSVLFGYDF